MKRAAMAVAVLVTILAAALALGRLEEERRVGHDDVLRDAPVTSRLWSTSRTPSSA